MSCVQHYVIFMKMNSPMVNDLHGERDWLSVYAGYLVIWLYDRCSGEAQGLKILHISSLLYLLFISLLVVPFCGKTGGCLCDIK